MFSRLARGLSTLALFALVSSLVAVAGCGESEDPGPEPAVFEDPSSVEVTSGESFVSYEGTDY